MMQSQYKQSFTSINKISLQIDKLSSIMNKEQLLTNQLQFLLKKQEQKSNQSSLISNLDEYFKEYDNPTTKSLPIDENNNTNSQMQQEDTQIMNTMYRNYLAQEGQEEDKENLHDDKSTVIINNKNIQPKDKHIEHKSNINYYTTLNQDNRSLKKETHSKSKKNTSKNPTSSMPSEIIANQQKNNNYQKNSSSIFKCPVKVDSIDHIKQKKNNQTEHQSNFIKELKGKLSKVNKIDKEELNRLQEKKVQKKTQLSSNRKNTRRQLGTVKSSATLSHTQKTSQTNINFISNNIKSNSSCKIAESKKKESLKKHQQKGPSNHQWQRNPDKVNKKLNRVNICKLQQNMKKNNQKKSQCRQTANKKIIDKTVDKKNKKQINQRRQLKLHFTENDETAMRKLIDQKQLNRQYTKQTDKYLQITKKMQKSYLQILIKECRQTSQQAIFKIKLVTLILYFFDQFASSSLIINIKIDPITQDFFTKIPEQQIINVLLHPKRILKLMADLPNILMNNNIISSQRVQIFNKKFQQINDQLDQQLQFFLIKKTKLFTYVHSLLQYMNFLFQKELISQTKRTKVVPTEQQKKLQGYYSSRSKRDEITKKCIKIKEKSNKFGFRCDSDRKITLQDEQMFLKGAFNNNNIKANPLKKIFK